ncbi:hypothetical protein [Methylobacterium sp. E-045]|uniref:hypothetical protein n=1 Tax=Methylobacterium sp. E-045 TaxID=2836575 RepID=UPI001FBAFF30|nr:hypothetical protein [Methylobacterium sp. E-045]MCJ2130202.1 hypothetical protein [Methylobacterium sp. E-045]
MPVESWMNPEETAALAADATTLIDSVLARLPEADRAAFWSSIRKCYNTPYNDPKPRALPVRDVMEATATAPHVAASIADLSTVGVAIAEPPQVEVAMGAILGGSTFGPEAHPA